MKLVIIACEAQLHLLAKLLQTHWQNTVVRPGLTAHGSQF
jgi:hypothetical protein